MGKNWNISLSEQKVILNLHKKGLSLRKIGEIVGRCHSSVQIIIRQAKKAGHLKAIARPGGPSSQRPKEEICESPKQELLESPKQELLETHNENLDEPEVEEPEFDPVIPEDERRFYKKAYPTVDLVRERRVHCTICKSHIGTAPAVESIIKMHPVLRVTHCTKCHDFYNSGEFSKGEDGSELYCRWCGQGGEVYCCSSCPFVFCKSCITKNLSRGVVADIEQNENWNCFNCSTKILWPLRAQHWALVKFIAQQKKMIKEGNYSEEEVKRMMANDRSTCCRLAKAKCGNMSDSMESIDSSTSRRSGVGSNSGLKKALKTPAPPGISPSAKRVKTSNDELVCEPDLMSMLEPDCQITETPKPSSSRPVLAPANSVPRIMTIQTGSNSNYNSPQTPKSTPPPLVLRNTSIKVHRATPNQPVVRQTVVGPRVPSPAVTTPVYHTINGFRIDLNSAAQQETFRLPNGKLIQVKRQGIPQTQSPSTPTSTVSSHNSTPNYQQPRQIISSPAQQVPPRRIQITNNNGVTHYQHASPAQPSQTQQTPQVIRYHNTMISNSNSQAPQNGGVQGLQIINGMPTAPTAQSSSTPVAAAGAAAGATANTNRHTLIRHVFNDTPIGQARSQLQEQVFGAMEICQHLAGKIHTLTNSNAYKTARNYLEIKELYIHMSYLLTYGIGRFKNLQEKCLADMRQLGFVNDADCLENGQLAADKQASDDEDNEIEIVEPKTDTITLDSDDEDSPVKNDSAKHSNQKTQQTFQTKNPQVVQRLHLLNKSTVGQSQQQTANKSNTFQLKKTTTNNQQPQIVVPSGRLIQIQPNHLVQARSGQGTQFQIRAPQQSQPPRLQIVQAQSLSQANITPKSVAIRQPPPLAPVSSGVHNTNVTIKPATSTTTAAKPSPAKETSSANESLSNSELSQDSLSSPTDSDFPESVDFMEAAQGFLASMLEVDIHEGSEPLEAKNSKKQPRKKLTNRPNPQLLELERQRLEEMKDNDGKLKMNCQVSLTKAEEEYPFLKNVLLNLEEKEENTIELSDDSFEETNSPKKNLNKDQLEVTLTEKTLEEEEKSEDKKQDDETNKTEAAKTEDEKDNVENADVSKSPDRSPSKVRVGDNEESNNIDKNSDDLLDDSVKSKDSLEKSQKEKSSLDLENNEKIKSSKLNTEENSSEDIEMVDLDKDNPKSSKEETTINDMEKMDVDQDPANLNDNNQDETETNKSEKDKNKESLSDDRLEKNTENVEAQKSSSDSNLESIDDNKKLEGNGLEHSQSEKVIDKNVDGALVDQKETVEVNGNDSINSKSESSENNLLDAVETSDSNNENLIEDASTPSKELQETLPENHSSENSNAEDKPISSENPSPLKHDSLNNSTKTTVTCTADATTPATLESNSVASS